MQVTVHHGRKWSDIGLKTAFFSFGASIAFSFAHGLLYALSIERTDSRGIYIALWNWCSDFRFLSEQMILVGVLLFVGAKFVETRHLFTVGFDDVDAHFVRVKGPDDENTVWIGHRYDSRVDAEAVATAFENRLRDSV